MSCNLIKMEQGHKVALPITSREQYLKLRSSTNHLANLRLTREGNKAAKMRLVQFNYSLGDPEASLPALPTRERAEKGEDSEGKNDTSLKVFPLKGATTVGNSVGMDIDQMIDVERVLAKKDELGLLMMERSATKGFHIVFRRHPEMTNEENLQWASDLLGVEFDKAAKDVTRVFFATSNSKDDLIYLDDELFCPTPALLASPPALPSREGAEASLTYLGIPYSDIVSKWWELNYDGKTPVKNNRDVLTFELAVNLRHICGFDRELLDKVIPCYDGFPQSQKMKCIDSALSERRTQMPRRLRDVLCAFRKDKNSDEEFDIEESNINYYDRLPKLPMGIRESVEAVGPNLAMPVITAVCPIIGALATGVRLDVHKVMRNLNLIAYIAGDFASGKGSIDPVVEAWCAEQKALDRMYLQQEDEWRERKRAAKNKKEQPEEPKLPIRCLTLNNTIANLAERLSNTGGKHAFSFTPEADTVAQKFRSSLSDFSVMIREAFDGTPYNREARSADAVNVHIDKLLWNVVMCGTPDALYRVVNNYTDGFQSRIAVARTPDNTFAQLDDNPPILTDVLASRIAQVAHLLPLMNGDVILPKLEKTGRRWLKQIVEETSKNDDKIRARQRFRGCVIAQRMTCCIMLCKVCEDLIKEHGLNGAETLLKQKPDLWKEMLLQAQTTEMLSIFDVLADSLIDNAVYFFYERIENAFASVNYLGSSLKGNRTRRSKNDSIYERLDKQFTFDQAFQQSVAIKSQGVTRENVRQMLKNWEKQGLIDSCVKPIITKLY